MQELVVATKNTKKLKELKDLLKDTRIKITSLADYPKTPRIVENGKTFAENAKKKATVIARFTGKLTLGEDSGLCVNVLGGKPGVYSSRFAGKNKSDAQNNRKLLAMLEGRSPKERRAHYACAIALADPRGVIGVAEGKCFGSIGTGEAGHFGFGYDPLFVIPKYRKTFAQLGPVIKHRMSHRFRALLKTKRMLKAYLASCGSASI